MPAGVLAYWHGAVLQCKVYALTYVKTPGQLLSPLSLKFFKTPVAFLGCK